MTQQQLSNRAKKAWRTRRAQTTNTVNSLSLRAKKAWQTRRNEVVTVNNTAFARLSPAGKRVAIAQDVINSLKRGQLTAANGTWVRVDDCLLTDTEAGTELQSLFKKKEVTCDVCALGACFVSAVKLGNNCKLTEDAKQLDGFEFYDKHENGWADDTGMWKVLSRYFVRSQMALIETAFEMGQGYYGNTGDIGDTAIGVNILGEERYYAAVNFGERYGDDESRMVAIMQNIVDNKGTFKP